jgi:hypothetical protein
MKNKKKILADVATLVMGWHRGRIEHLKLRASSLEREDFVWHYLLQSFATMGRSSGWLGLIGTPENYNELRYERLQQIKTRLGRLNHVKRICHQAKVRMPDMKAGYICGCFDKIEKLGGYKKVKAELLSLTDRDSMIFLSLQLSGYRRQVRTQHDDGCVSPLFPRQYCGGCTY